jgi:hypothetical protein
VQIALQQLTLARDRTDAGARIGSAASKLMDCI